MRNIDTTVMAYIGDAVYETHIRCLTLAEHQTLRAGALHKIAIQYVKSESQAAAVKALVPFLTEEEKEIVRIARNKKSISRPKNASPVDYKLSTGFEALIGYLYIKGDIVRCNEIMKKAVEIIDEEKNGV